MGILLINGFPHQTPLLLNVCNNMQQHSIELDLFNYISGLFYANTPKNKSFFYTFYKNICSVNIIRKFFTHFFLKRILCFVARNYDIIDFQGLFNRQFIHIIPALKQQGKAIIITVWGSDFYRQAAGTWKEKAVCFEHCDLIHIATKQMKEDFLAVYPQYENKIRIAHFGLSQLETLKNMMSRPHQSNDLLSIIPNDKIIITCGYNGIKAQQHELIIKAMTELPIEMQSRLYLLFPMTYGADDIYINRIETLLQTTNISYKIFSKRLSLEELMTLRIKTNIVVNIQKTDAFAASLQEHIMAGNLLVVGEWLPYRILDEHDIYIRRTSISALPINIQWAIENYDTMQQKLNENQEKMYQLSSWKYVSDKWANIYQELS